MSDSLYSQYIAEREGLSGVWVEWGFVTYKIAGAECFLADLFIRKESRRAGALKSLLNDLFKVARAEKCSTVTAHIHLNDPNANHTLRAALACGFRVVGAVSGTLIIEYVLAGGQ